MDLITGYYRYTDIWFVWKEALHDPRDGDVLKAFIAHDALTHPEHPLRREGDDGITLFMGTLNSGMCRLLFSSDQVDYIRYWLHAMKLTNEIIPVPYSDCLLTNSDLKNVSPISYPDGGSLRNSLKQIEKNNKRLKGTKPSLASRRDMFERVRKMWAEKVGVWCAMDFEAWDRDHTLLTEFGWSLVRWEHGKEIEERGHLIVAERRRYMSTYVPQWRDNYNFGQSEDVDKSAFKARIQTMLDRHRRDGPLFLILHDHSQDIKYLNSDGVQAPITGFTHVLPYATPKGGIFIIDTAEMFAALVGEESSNKHSLATTCRHLNIPYSFLHNAGNDAHYTLLSMRSMASGDPLDIQREKRWPSASSTSGVKVQLRAKEESDFSDEEDMALPVSGYHPVTGDLIDTGVVGKN